METIVITEPEYRKGKAVFDTVGNAFRILVSPPDEESLSFLIRENQARAAVVGVESYRRLLYESFPSGGGIIARFGVGTDGIDKNLIQKFGLVLTNTPGVLDQSVAELTVLLIGNLLRHITRVDQNIRHGMFAGICGSLLKGKNLALIGFGNIAREVARIASAGFGMRVHAFDIFDESEICHLHGVSFSEFLKTFFLTSYTNRIENILSSGDIVSCHLPALPQTAGFFRKERFDLFRPGALFINTSRGSIVREEDLWSALQEGKVGGAALDVFQTEPYTPLNPEHDLRRFDNVILTPHIGSNTAEANLTMAQISLKCVTDYLQNINNICNWVA